MEKLTIVFVALFVAAVVAAPDNLLTNFKSLGHFKRAANATLLKPQKKNLDEVKLLVQMLDNDHDNMMDVDELKSWLVMGGAPEAQINQNVEFLMIFDTDKNKKLDINELKTVGDLTGF